MLPEEDTTASEIGNNSNNNNNHGQAKYGSTWQERMVKHYHSHLYKEYVLADLSHVYSKGKVGLRWRTEGEVVNGRGFSSCGNLMCESGACSKKTTIESSVLVDGSGKPTSEEAGKALEIYLQSCARERRKIVDKQQQQLAKNHAKKQHKHSKNHHKHHRKHSKHSKEKCHGNNFHLQNTSPSINKPTTAHNHNPLVLLSPSNNDVPTDHSSLKKQESKEQTRLARLIPHGIGLHDYEVDFAYIEQGARKRELVKVRLCLRCAPLLFVCKSSSGVGNGDRGIDELKKGPATKAREAREKAAYAHARMALANSRNEDDDADVDVDDANDEQNDTSSRINPKLNIADTSRLIKKEPQLRHNSDLYDNAPGKRSNDEDEIDNPQRKKVKKESLEYDAETDEGSCNGDTDGGASDDNRSRGYEIKGSRNRARSKRHDRGRSNRIDRGPSKRRHTQSSSSSSSSSSDTGSGFSSQSRSRLSCCSSS